MGFDKDENGELMINPEEAVVVRRIYEAFLAGRSMSRIARELKRDGIKTVNGKYNWWDTTIRKMLKNEKYCGDALLQKTVTVDFLMHKRVKNNGQEQQFYVESNHTGIISKEMFLAVQVEMARRGSSEIRHVGKYVLTGKVFCGLCGVLYTRRTWRIGSGKRTGGTRNSRLGAGEQVASGTVNSAQEAGGQVAGGTGNEKFGASRAGADNIKGINADQPGDSSTHRYLTKAVWQCRRYVREGAKVCRAKAVDDEKIKRTFIRVFNMMYKHKEAFIGVLENNVRKVLSRDCTEEKMREVEGSIAAVKRELKALVQLQVSGDHGLSEKALGDSICQEEYVRIKSELENLKSQKENLESHLTILRTMKRRTDDLVITLQDRKDLLTLFDESLFMVMVEKVTVKPSGGLEFQLKNGVGVE